MKQTDIIDRKALKEHLDMVCGNDTPWGKAQQAYIECFKEFVDHESSIDQSEAVKTIWSAQIDDLIEQIKTLAWKDSNVGVDDVIEILEGAK